MSQSYEIQQPVEAFTTPIDHMGTLKLASQMALTSDYEAGMALYRTVSEDPSVPQTLLTRAHLGMAGATLAQFRKEPDNQRKEGLAESVYPIFDRILENPDINPAESVTTMLRHSRLLAVHALIVENPQRKEQLLKAAHSRLPSRRLVDDQSLGIRYGAYRTSFNITSSLAEFYKGKPQELDYLTLQREIAIQRLDLHSDPTDSVNRVKSFARVGETDFALAKLHRGEQRISYLDEALEHFQEAFDICLYDKKTKFDLDFLYARVKETLISLRNMHEFSTQWTNYNQMLRDHKKRYLVSPKIKDKVGIT